MKHWTLVSRQLLNEWSAVTMGAKIKAVMIDLSGTLHIEDTAIYGAQDALQRLAT